MSALFLIRVFAYLVLPLILAGIVIAVDKSVNTRERRLEIFLIYMFAFTAAGGIAGALGHFFVSDAVAEAIGWPAGSPFQLEMGFANLAMGMLAAITVTRRDGFREATVIGGAILSLGAFIVHIIDIAQHGNLAAGNTLINITNLGRPALLIYFLWAGYGNRRGPAADWVSIGPGRWSWSGAGDAQANPRRLVGFQTPPDNRDLGLGSWRKDESSNDRKYLTEFTRAKQKI